MFKIILKNVYFQLGVAFLLAFLFVRIVFTSAGFGMLFVAIALFGRAAFEIYKEKTTDSSKKL